MPFPELDGRALLERVVSELVGCLAAGSLNGHDGALMSSQSRSEIWTARFAQLAVGKGPIFPGARLAKVAELVSGIADGTTKTSHIEDVLLGANDSVVLFQRCPWDPRGVLFFVFHASAAIEPNFVKLRQLLESVRRDVAIMRAPRMERHYWN